MTDQTTKDQDFHREVFDKLHVAHACDLTTGHGRRVFQQCIEFLIDHHDADLTALRAAVPQWWPIESAPKGSWRDGPRNVTDPAYIAPPHIWLLLEDGRRCVGYADAYYAEGGSAYDGGSFWVEEFSGERVTPTHFQPLPAPPTLEGSKE